MPPWANRLVEGPRNHPNGLGGRSVRDERTARRGPPGRLPATATGHARSHRCAAVDPGGCARHDPGRFAARRDRVARSEGLISSAPAAARSSDGRGWRRGRPIPDRGSIPWCGRSSPRARRRRVARSGRSPPPCGRHARADAPDLGRLGPGLGERPLDEHVLVAPGRLARLGHEVDSGTEHGRREPRASDQVDGRARHREQGQLVRGVVELDLGREHVGSQQESRRGRAGRAPGSSRKPSRSIATEKSARMEPVGVEQERASGCRPAPGRPRRP